MPDDVRLKDGRVVRIRPLEADDKEAVVEFYSGLSPYALKWALPPYDRTRVERFFANPEQLIGMAGLFEGRVVGHLHVFRHMSRMNHVGDLIIYLNQDFHNVGLGTAMMSSGLVLAKARGLRRLELSVTEGNTNAIHLYEKVGFRREGVRAEAYHAEDGKYYDAVEMGLLLH